MTLLRRLSSGLFAIVLLSIVTAEHAQSAGYQLYEQMHTLTNQQLALQDVSDDVITYVARVARQEKLFSDSMTEDEIITLTRLALQNKLNDFCKTYGNLDTCQQVSDELRDLARDAIDTQALTTDLLSIATGHETGVSGRMGEIFTVPEHLLNIRRIWLSRDDALMTTEALPPIRAVPRPDALSDSLFDQLGQALADAGSDAVWRYRYGASAFLDSDEYCRNGAGDPELFDFTTRRWCTVEEKLRAIREKLPNNEMNFDPPLQPGEIVIFPLRKLDSPPHVIVWMMAESGSGGVIERDVGVGWDLTLTPSQLGMLREAPLDPCSVTVGDNRFCTIAENYWIRPGGPYADPPAAEDFGGGLCHLPFARDSYLCRPQRFDRCDKKIEDKEPLSIVLTECKPMQALQPVGLTESGPDTCRTSWWRTPIENPEDASDTAEEDPDLRPGSCSNCIVDLICSDGCGGIDGFDSKTNLKNENGVIKICLSRNNPGALRAADIVHELTHSEQICSSMLKTMPIDMEMCCAYEAEAYRVSCRILAMDGLLEKAGVSLEECMGAGTNKSCLPFGEGACTSMDTETIWNKLMQAANADTASHASCDELVNNLELYLPVAASMKEGLENVCTPNCRTKYENSIGGNLCYVGQCIEQSVEQSRIIPGRMPFTVQDEAFPWDACAAKDPRNGALIALPAISSPLPPAYNPRLLVESLDRALCQINGLPVSIPPILCQFDYSRRLAIPAENPLATALSFGNQTTEQEDPMASLQRMTQSIATRIGTGLLERYLRWSGRSLSEMLQTGNQLMKNMEETKFPDTTCPRNAAEEPSFCTASSPSE